VTRAPLIAIWSETLTDKDLASLVWLLRTKTTSTSAMCTSDSAQSCCTRQAGFHDGQRVLYRASTHDCGRCPLKSRCCPKAPERKIPRNIYEDARDAARALADTNAFEQSRRDRKRVEMLFAHLKRILRMGRLRLRGPRGAQDEFTLAAIAQNLRRLAKLVARPPPAAVACAA
jgi:hypothetical protein